MPRLERAILILFSEGGGTDGRRQVRRGPTRDPATVHILVTGHRGRVGAPVVGHLQRSGHYVTGFDLSGGDDLLDLDAVKQAAAGCAAIVHLGALANSAAGKPDEVMDVNVTGTSHVLLAAEAAGVARVVHFSSVQVLGIAEGERHPDYFPVDDGHPRRATRPYGVSKRVAEDLCESFSERTGITTVVLRPVAVWAPGRYRDVERNWQRNARSEWEPFWEYGAFIDERDVATAVDAALSVPLEGHHRALLCAEDVAGSAPSLELARRLVPAVPVRDGARYALDPWRALVDCSVAETVLGWRPQYRWADRELSPPGPEEWRAQAYHVISRLCGRALTRARKRR